MKTKEYVEKYSLDKSPNIDHNSFAADLTNEFFSLLEIGKNKEGNINLKGYENAINCIRRKWDAVNNKTVGQLPEKLWNYFYATVIVKMRDEMFPEQMKKRQEEREFHKKRREERRSYDDMWSNMFANMFLSSLFGQELHNQ